MVRKIYCQIVTALRHVRWVGDNLPVDPVTMYGFVGSWISRFIYTDILICVQ